MSLRAHHKALAGVLVAALAPLPVPAQSEAPIDLGEYDRGWHIVRPGENLHFISRKYVGDKLLWRENWKLNPQIQDPDRLTPGERIQVLIERRVSVPTALLRSIAGRVDGKPAPISWNPAREQDLMLEEDGLRTGKRASTEMEFQDGTRVLMTEESLVYLRRRGRRLTGVPPQTVEIVEGQAEVAARRAAGSERAIEIVVGGTRAVSRPDASGVAQTRARRAADAAAKVMVYEGDGEVESGGRKVAVARGMGTSVEQGRPPAPPEKLLPSPEGLLPEAGWRVTFNNVELAWQPVAGAATYTVELCVDPECALLVQRRVGLAGPVWEPDAPAPGEYFWRVTAVSASGLDGYPSAGAALAILGGPDRTGPGGSLSISGPQLKLGRRLIVDENVRIEPVLEDGQSGVGSWRPVIDGAEVSRQRWGGPWPDGDYQVTVRAVDRAGNESVLRPVELTVDARPPRLTVAAVTTEPGSQPPQPDRCGWLVRSSWRWLSLTECRWLRRAQESWLTRGWRWLEVSVDGRFWAPLIEPGSPLLEEVSGARHELPAEPATVLVRGDHPQLLVRAADGTPLRLPDGSGAATERVRIQAVDAGAGVDRLRLRVEVAEAGGLALEALAIDVFGHQQVLSWRALP